MSVERRNADGFALQVMIGLCLIWGVQQVMIKWAAPDIAPVMQAAGRSGISALLVGLLLCWKGGWDQVSNTWRGDCWPVRCSVWSSSSSPKACN